MPRIIKGAWMKLGAPSRGSKKKTRGAAASDAIYQLKIVLKGSNPSVWRRVQLRGGTTLLQLHSLIQATMGWEDEHLYYFDVDKVRYAPPELDSGFDDDSLRVADYSLQSIAPVEKSKFKYEYDMGDGWVHTVVVEKILPADANRELPKCMAGAGACPPEDCGGLWGYYAMLDTLTDPRHEDYAWMKERLGAHFDPTAFDAVAVNQRLKEHRRAAR